MILQDSGLSRYSTPLTLQHSEPKTSYMPTMTLYRQLEAFSKIYADGSCHHHILFTGMGRKYLSAQNKILSGS
jgi:hypothetical protein